MEGPIYAAVGALLMWALVLPMSTQAQDPDAFVTTWETTSANEEIFIPTSDQTGVSYDFTIDWGDGTVEDITGTNPNPAHTYSTAGVYTVSITGTFPHLFLDAADSGDGDSENARKLQTVEQWGSIRWKSMTYAFAGAENMTYNASDTPDLSSASSMLGMFSGASDFSGDISIGIWDVSNVTTTRFMFQNTSFDQDVGTWEVDNVTDMGGMFNGAASFNQDLGEWNVSNVTDMMGMFLQATSFDGEISDWNVSSVENMGFMFNGAESFNQDIGEWETRNVQVVSAFFGGMFGDASSFNQDISGWDLSNVTDMDGMFWGATSFNQDISEWDVTNVTSMRDMFFGATAFNQDLSRWNVSSVFENGSGFDNTMEGIFDNSGLSPTNYDRTITSWAGQDLNADITLGASGTQYCNSGPFQEHLEAEYNWTVTNAGQAAGCPTTLVGDGFSDVSSDGAVTLGDTDVAITFNGTNGTSGRVTAGRFDDLPRNVSGVSEANVSPYRVIIVAGSGLSFSNTTQVRFDASAFGGINDANDIAVYSRPVPGSGDFTPVNNFFYDEGANEIVAETGSFSEFIFASDTNPLPVELSAFDATLSGDDAVLVWETVSETNNAGFEVQRANGSTGITWQTIARLEGAGTTDTPQSYQFTDTDLPYAADSLRYRLRQIDTDGTESFSEAITIARQVTQAELLPTYPNPASGQATVRFAVPDRQDVRIALYDMLGRRVQTIVNADAEGRTEQVLDVSGLASGTYFLRMQTDSHTETQRVTVVR